MASANSNNPTGDRGKIAVVGSGLIGRSWALVFAAAGYTVSIYDIDTKQISAALEYIEEELRELSKDGSLRGQLSAEEQRRFISGSSDLKECLAGAFYVQECVRENLETKKQVFKQFDELAVPGMILGSSTSCILPSYFTEDLTHRSQCIVAHPVNPPYFVPLVELVPTPWTEKDVVVRTKQLMKNVEQVPVVLNKEIDGFCLNRIQYAIINEAWRLVESGVVSAEDIDLVMSAGMGPRYAFIGPLEVAHLNAEGIKAYMKHFGAGMERVTKAFGPVPNYSNPTPDHEEVEKQLCELVPLSKLHDARAWRDRRLTALAKLKRKMDSADPKP